MIVRRIVVINDVDDGMGWRPSVNVTWNLVVGMLVVHNVNDLGEWEKRLGMRLVAIHIRKNMQIPRAGAATLHLRVVIIQSLLLELLLSVAVIGGCLLLLMRLHLGVVLGQSLMMELRLMVTVGSSELVMESLLVELLLAVLMSESLLMEVCLEVVMKHMDDLRISLHGLNTGS